MIEGISSSKISGSPYPIRKRLSVFFTAFIFAVAFAYIESAVVTYLRKIFYPDGFKFPMNLVFSELGYIELGREAMTIVMLFTVAFITGKTKYQRWSYFLFLFGVWDIFYYIWLKVFIDWPPSFLTWDILFLLPVPWTSPVLAVVTVAFIITLFGAIGIFMEYSGYHLEPRMYHWILASSGSFIIYYSFIIDWKWIVDGGIPHYYPWWLLSIGDLILLGTSIQIIFQSLKSKGNKITITQIQ
jgi:hypothetical protein